VLPGKNILTGNAVTRLSGAMGNDPSHVVAGTQRAILPAHKQVAGEEPAPGALVTRNLLLDKLGQNAI
jgi:hypothetical protein